MVNADIAQMGLHDPPMALGGTFADQVAGAPNSQRVEMQLEEMKQMGRSPANIKQQTSSNHGEYQSPRADDIDIIAEQDMLLSDRNKMRNLARKYAQTSYSDDVDEDGQLEPSRSTRKKSGGKEPSSVKRENVEPPIFSSDQFQPMPVYQRDKNTR